jgi:hypothetical protein
MPTSLLDDEYVGSQQRIAPFDCGFVWAVLRGRPSSYARFFRGGSYRKDLRQGRPRGTAGMCGASPKMPLRLLPGLAFFGRTFFLLIVSRKVTLSLAKSKD